MKKIAILLAVLFLALTSLTACSETMDAPPLTPTPTSTPAESQTPTEPTVPETEEPAQEEPGEGEPAPVISEPSRWMDAIEETILLEGMEETIRLVRYDQGGIFATYVPDTMTADSVSSGEGEVHRFFANFQDVKKDDVYLKLFFFPEGTEQPDVIAERGRLALQHLELERVDPAERVHAWSLEEYSVVNSEGYHAYVMLGEHQGQYFCFILHYPWEWEGFGPRALKVIQHLYWTDTNAYLAER